MMDEGFRSVIEASKAECLSYDGLVELYRRFFNGWEYRKVKILDDYRYRLEHRNSAKNEVITMSANSVGTRAAWSRTDGSISVANMITNRHSFTIKDAHGRDKNCVCIGWNPIEADKFVSVGSSYDVKVWNCSDSKNPSFKSFVTEPKMKNSKCVFDPFGKWLIVLTKSDEIYTFNVSSGFQLHSVSKLHNKIKDDIGKADSSCSICWLNDGKHICVGFKQGYLKILKLSENGFEFINKSVGHLDEISCLAVDPWGLYLAAGSFDGSCSLWSLKDFTCITTLSDFEGIIESISISNDGFVLLVGSHQISKETSSFTYLSLVNQEKIFEQTFKNNSHSVSCFVPESLKLLIAEERDTVSLIKSNCQSILQIPEEASKMESNYATNFANKRATVSNDARKPSKKHRPEKLRSKDKTKDSVHRSATTEENSRIFSHPDDRFVFRKEEALRYRSDRNVFRGKDEYISKRF